MQLFMLCHQDESELKPLHKMHATIDNLNEFIGRWWTNHALNLLSFVTLSLSLWQSQTIFICLQFFVSVKSLSCCCIASPITNRNMNKFLFFFFDKNLFEIIMNLFYHAEMDSNEKKNNPNKSHRINFLYNVLFCECTSTHTFDTCNFLMLHLYWLNFYLFSVKKKNAMNKIKNN